MNNKNLNHHVFLNFQIVLKIVHLDRKLKLIKIEFPYEKLKKFLHLQVGVIMVLIVLTSKVICLTIHPNNHSFLHRYECLTFICGIPIIVSSYKITQIINLINIIVECYDKTNVYFIESVETMPLRLAMTNTSEIYSDLNEVTQLLKISSTSFISISVATQFTIITISMYSFFVSAVDSLEVQPRYIVITLFWIFMQTTILYYYIHGFECISQLSGFLSRSVNQLDINMVNHKCMEQVKTLQTSLDSYFKFIYFKFKVIQLLNLHQQQSFTAAGLFAINYGLISAIISSIASFLVMLIQFHLQTTDQ